MSSENEGRTRRDYPDGKSLGVEFWLLINEIARLNAEACSQPSDRRLKPPR